MDEQTRYEHVKETLIGIAAGSVSVVVIVLLMEGGPGIPAGDAVLLLLLAFTAPFVFLPSAPWLILLILAAGVAAFFQYRHIPPRFMRYLVGAEIIGWQVLGMRLLSEFIPS